MAYAFAVHSRAAAVLVTDDAIVNARQILWDNRRVVVDTVAQRRWPRCCPAHRHPVQQSGSQLCCAERTPTRLTWSSGEEFAGEYPTDAGQAGVLCTLIGLGVFGASLAQAKSYKVGAVRPWSEMQLAATPRACQNRHPVR